MSLLRDIREALRDGVSAPAPGPVHQELRAWPFWCDAQAHLNNASYLTIAALGRIRWLLRHQLVAPLVRAGQSPVVAGASILYRREIPLMARFRLSTELVAASPRFLAFRSTFVLLNGPPMAAAHAIGRVALRRGGSSSTSWIELAQARGLDLSVRMPPSADVIAWEDAQLAALRFLEAPSRT